MKKPNSKSLRSVPAVEKVLQALGEVALPRPMVVSVVRRELAIVRELGTIPELPLILEQIQSELESLRLTKIQPVINGTGVLIHTNLGRSPLGPATLSTLGQIGGNYNNLEFDLKSGERGGRAGFLEMGLAMLCESEAATVVNNCAAALVLCLRHFTAGTKPEVVISRGELVQIGGGFRIPEILEASGARLREVGTTNKTTVKDYEQAIGPQTGLILKVHRSNFYMEGFVESPSTEELSALARAKDVPCLEDLGSGAVTDTEALAGLEREPTPAEIIRRGMDLVCFSGDKLLGGPQAGIIAGQRKLVAGLKKEPFFRALRCDKLILAALQSTVELYLGASKPRSDWEEIPILRMMKCPVDDLRARGGQMIAELSDSGIKASLTPAKSQIGGGTLPRSLLESMTLTLRPAGMALAELSRRLRVGQPPVIGYISTDSFKLDLRTIFPEQDRDVIAALRHAIGRASNAQGQSQ